MLLRQFGAFLVASFSIIPPYGQVPDGSVRLEGAVYDAVTGVPLSDVRVAAGIEIETDGQGSFVVNVDIDAEDCGAIPNCERIVRFTAEKSGYAPLQWQAVLGEAAQVDGIVLRLQPLGGVAGRLFGSRGEPLPGVRIVPFRFTYNEAGMRQRVNFVTGRPAVSNDLGEYRIASLPPGEYFLEFIPEPIEVRGMFLIPLYYPGALEHGRAEPIHISPSETTRVRDIALFAAPAHSLTLHIEDQTEEGTTGALVGLSVYRQGSTRVPFATRRIVMNSRVVAAELRLPAGQYDVVAAMAKQISGMASVRIDTASTEARVPLRTLSMATLTGRALTDERSGQRPVSGVRLGLFPMEPERLSILDPQDPVIVISQEDGSFPETRLRSGLYRARLLGTPSDKYVEGVFSDGGEVGTTLIFEPGAGKDLAVTLAQAPTSIQGTVADENGNAAKAIVSFIPEAMANPINLRIVQTDPAGRFRVEVAPGRYHVYAWSNIEGAPYYDADFLKQFVGTVVIAEPDSSILLNLEVLQ